MAESLLDFIVPVFGTITLIGGGLAWIISTATSSATAQSCRAKA